MSERPQSLILTHLPSTEELAQTRVFTKLPTYGQVNHALLAGFDPTDPTSTEDDLERVLLKNFGSELQWGDANHHDRLVQDAYAVSREIGDKLIRDVNLEAFHFIDSVRGAITFGASFSAKSSLAGHVQAIDRGPDSVTEQHMGVDVSQAYRLGDTRRALDQRLATSGVEVKPSDISLLTMLWISAHETGHMIQGGINSELPAEHDERYVRIHDVDAFTKQTLMIHPEYGQTGNLETDARILNEGFAEGYGLIVVKRAAELLGYDEESVAAIMVACQHTEGSVETSALLSQVTVDKGLRAILKEKGSDAYYGEFGYARPLNIDQIASTLETAGTVLRSGDKQLPDAAHYAQQFGRIHKVSPRKSGLEDHIIQNRRGRLGRLFQGKLRKIM